MSTTSCHPDRITTIPATCDVPVDPKTFFLKTVKPSCSIQTRSYVLLIIFLADHWRSCHNVARSFEVSLGHYCISRCSQWQITRAVNLRCQKGNPNWSQLSSVVRQRHVTSSVRINQTRHFEISPHLTRSTRWKYFSTNVKLWVQATIDRPHLHNRRPGLPLLQNVAFYRVV